MESYQVLQLWREPWLASDSCVVLASSPHCSLLSLSPLMLAHCAHHRLMLAYPPPEKPWFSSAYLASWPPPTRKMPRFKLENSFQLDYLLPHNIATKIMYFRQFRIVVQIFTSKLQSHCNLICSEVFGNWPTLECIFLYLESTQPLQCARLVWTSLENFQTPSNCDFCCCNYYHHPPTIGVGLSRLFWCWCGPVWRALRHCGPQGPDTCWRTMTIDSPAFWRTMRLLGEGRWCHSSLGRLIECEIRAKWFPHFYLWSPNIVWLGGKHPTSIKQC